MTSGVAPTCVSTGHGLGICSRCGLEERDENEIMPIDPAAHNWNSDLICVHCSAEAFQLTVTVTADDLTFRLPIKDGSENNFTYYAGNGYMRHYTDSPENGEGELIPYGQPGEYIIILTGHTYFKGTYNEANGGALGFGFGSSTTAGTYGEQKNREKLTGIKGRLPCLLGDYVPASKVFIFASIFRGCANLTGSIPVELFSGINWAPALSMFQSTFENCRGLTGSIPSDLFSGIKGAPAVLMFSDTFNGCSGLTSIPSGLFIGIKDAPATGMFQATFRGCNGLKGSIPDNLFGDLVGRPAAFMFSATFLGCNSLESISPRLFSGISGAPMSYMFQTTFWGCSSLKGSLSIMCLHYRQTLFSLTTFYLCCYNLAADHPHPSGTYSRIGVCLCMLLKMVSITFSKKKLTDTT